ncbi:MAG: gliding motility-associated ABC transporter ATP-binding subunit GldA [Crocinitomicaceae bacterium]|nr:gliding motility-associated ABC transporter ATP-binding subunit GldA [Crocinitomicaceae bacterium]
MSIRVNEVVKIYGKQRALNGVSFSIDKGEVIGFLGPNGAGKSTMMKIITGYIPPTSGKVSVCDFDILESSPEARRQIGYLPEHNPLYLDMYVKEYLTFTAEIYKMPQVKKRVDEMIDRVGLGPEAHKKIAALSKGYRQRVGLAQSMIHDPKVLILDEPTSGLDPNQLVEIRALIKELGKEKTVMLSTHIMQDVEAVCSRAIIVNKGNIVADRSTSELRIEMGGDGQGLVVEFSGRIEEKELLSINGVAGVLEIGKNTWRVRVSGNADVRLKISELAVEKGVVVLMLRQEEQRMEDIFKALTNS